MTRRVTVIGGGIMGACAAHTLAERGHHVTLVEPGSIGGEQAASFGNGAWISPASVVPMSVPGTWKKIPGYLLDPTGPLTIRWRHFPHMLPWLLRFVAAGFTVKQVERTASALASLLADAPARHRQLACAIRHPEMIITNGLLYVYPNRQAFEAEAFSWGLRRQNGVRWGELDARELHELEPSLSSRYEFGAFVRDGAHCIDPGGYVAAIVDNVVRSGGKIFRARARGFSIVNGRLEAVETDAGTVPCDAAVIAAGVHSGPLAVACGDRVPLESERGYHVTCAGDAGPAIPIMPSDSRAANTPTRSGFRIAGQVEIASIGAAPNWQRSEILLRQATAAYPSLREKVETMRVTRWMGHRPSTPDGLPVIDRSFASHDVVYAFGHGHVGLASGPATGYLIADLVDGRPASVDMTPFSARRFGLISK